MTKHRTGTRQEWLGERLELLEAEKELTRRSDELAQRRQTLPWVRVDKSFPWASSFRNELNSDFSVSFTAEEQRAGRIEYNYRHGGHAMDVKTAPEPVRQFAAMCGTDEPTYTRDRPGMSAFALEDGAVYHTYSTYARGLDTLWGAYQWLDRGPMGRNEAGIWWRRHDEYDNG
jgi:predicted dithiol-disulfide oxidoreductase (DUF899 family)